MPSRSIRSTAYSRGMARPVQLHGRHQHPGLKSLLCIPFLIHTTTLSCRGLAPWSGMTWAQCSRPLRTRLWSQAQPARHTRRVCRVHDLPPMTGSPRALEVTSPFNPWASHRLLLAGPECASDVAAPTICLSVAAADCRPCLRQQIYLRPHNRAELPAR